MEKRFLEFLKIEELENSLLLEQAYCYPAKGCYKARLPLSYSLMEFATYIKAKAKVLLYEPEKYIVFNLQYKKKTYKVFLEEKELRWAIVEDREEAKEVLRYLLEIFLELFQKKDELTPDFNPIKRPPALEIYKGLPKTNCKECGEISCLAFAIKLSMAEVEVSQCPYIKGKFEGF
ncbi:MAG: (Fe-S)-binding protein [Caldimicrobium sp.]